MALFVAHKDKIIELLKSGNENISSLRRVKDCEYAENIVYLYHKPYKNLQKMEKYSKLGFKTVEISTDIDHNLWA